MPVVRLLVASNDPIVRRGFHEIVRERSGWSVSSEAAGVPELLERLRENSTDGVVVDLPLGDRSGTDVLAEVRQAAPKVALIVFAAYAIEHYATAFLEAGANAFVRRNAEPKEILDAIAAAANGGRYRQAMTDRPPRPHELLSARELEVFRHLASGHKPTAIAALLSLSIKTVSTYRARILQKTGFRSNADIVSYAIRTRLV